MKRIALGAAIVGIALTLAGCKGLTFNGSLNVSKPFTVETPVEEKDPYCDRLTDRCDPPRIVIQKKTYQPGVYQANIRIVNKNLINLNVGREAPVALRIPRDITLPDVSGEFDLTAEQVGQSFDVHGKVDTVVTDSPSRFERESCNFQEPYQRCHFEGSPGGPRYICYTDWRTRFGRQDVEYFVRNTRKDVAMDFLAQGTRDVTAAFGGVNEMSEKIYTYRGTCH